ncbi:low temperature requirement protein A [Micromonospora sp. PPF5-17]|uniref:Low temperature requirement protein A n=1 Tax=Micromonospora solifontis TaxID=2487138 RepID=A0ABX9WG58_9ACTN|nr:low temperature requirement protein A [Micromonospora sp. PPF5-17B]NES36972.1 low temperature requirement protein A [Micromonospora solifontis]NES54291.1 low temperature requirement protein A [Micromonospora sp. PPF5-6]RNL98915.1 low temperature requirement protein A [Micromonospora solifontis]
MVQRGAPGSRTTRLELFFDLVFVFAFINVTSLTATTPTPLNLYRCLLVLALLWWCWTGFARVGNAVRTDQGLLPVLGFVTVAAIFLLVLSIPGAFVDRPGGLDGPLVFAGCYFLIRGVQLAIFISVERGNPARRRSLLPRLMVPMTATALLVVAGTVPQRVASGTPAALLQLALWTMALLVEYVAGVILARIWWVVVSAGHWAERHALMVLIALGETIIALGLGARFFTDLPLTLPVAVAAVLGIVVTAMLWWAYFDTLAFALEQALHHARDPATRLHLARDAYTFLHLPMIAGIIFFALALKDLLAEAAEPGSPPWGVPLGGFWISVFYGGVALHLLSVAACAYLALRTVRWPLLLAVVVLVGVAPLAARLPELAALAVLAVLTVAAITAETLSENGRRRQVRQLALEEQLDVEEEQSRWRREHL